MINNLDLSPLSLREMWNWPHECCKFILYNHFGEILFTWKTRFSPERYKLEFLVPFTTQLGKVEIYSGFTSIRTDPQWDNPQAYVGDKLEIDIGITFTDA